MVDEVQISNVGGKGVASEVTLVKLQQSIDRMAKSKGLDPKEANKSLDDLKNSLNKNSNTIGDETKSREDHINVLDNHSSALRRAGGLLFQFGGAILGSGIRSIQGLTDSLISGTNNLSDFTRHIPLAGGVISMFTGIIDNSVTTFQSMAKTGAAFDYSMGQLRSTAAQAGLSLEQFAGLVNQNSQEFAAFGGTVTQGARRTVQLVEALGDQRESLLGMGLTFEDINEQMTTYQMLTRAGARAETRDRSAQAEAAASLTKNMLTLSKLTGEDIKSQQDKIAQAQMDVAFQRELAKLDEQERQKLNQAMADAQAAGGDIAVQAIKAEFLGMPPLTRELQTFVGTQGESFRLLQDSVASVRNTAISAEQFEEQRIQRMGDYLETQLAAQNRFDTALAAGAAGAEGIVATLSEQMGMSADLLMRYVKNTGDGLEFAREAFEEDFLSGEMGAVRDSEIGAVAAFTDALRTTRSALMDNLVNPLLEIITPAIVVATQSLNNFTQSEAFTEFSEAIRVRLEQFQEWFGSWIEKFTEDPQQAWNDLLENHIKPFFDKAIQGAKEAIGQAFKDLITGPEVIGALVAGFAALFAARAVTAALATGLTNLLASGGGGGGRRGGRGGALRAAGGFLGRAAAPLAIGVGLLQAGRTLSDDELTREEKGREVSGIAGGTAGGLAGMKAGAAIGALGGPIGMALGALIGGGAGYFAGGAIGKGAGRLFFRDREEEEISAPSQVVPPDTRFEPSGLTTEELRSFELNHLEINKSSKSLDRIATQLEEITNQLQSDNLTGLSQSDIRNETAVGSDQDGKLEEINTTLVDILRVLMETHNIDRRQLSATRAMSNNLYAGL